MRSPRRRLAARSTCPTDPVRRARRRSHGSLVTLFAGATLLACQDARDPVQPDVRNGLAPAFAVAAYDCAAQTVIPSAECEGLVALYVSTNGEGWVNDDGWLIGDDPCTWRGIACLNGSVVGIVLPFNQLTGPLPPQIEQLPGLQVLDLFDNRLNGSIPPELGNLPALRTLVITYNQLTGAIPPELGGLANLEVLFAFGNQLDGSIPPELGQLGSLRYLSLGVNQLTGSIPAELGNLTGLNELNLRYNRLTGAIPAALENLTQIGTGPGAGFALDGNLLSGLVPIGVARLGGIVAERLFPDECWFRPGNPDLYMPDIASYRALDLDGDGTICRLGFTGTSADVAQDLAGTIDDLLASGAVNGGQANALSRKIEQAMRLLENGKNSAAANVLGALIQQAHDMVADGVLTPEEGERIVTRAEILIALID